MKDTDLTLLLNAAAEGDRDAEAMAITRLHEQLRSIARQQLGRGPRAGDHGVSATVLVNEAYLRVFGHAQPRWQNREHLLAVTAQAMRNLLIDDLRRRQAAKRPQDEERLQLTEIAESLGDEVPADDLHDALEQLKRLDPRQAQIVDLRFFVGMTSEEIAEAIGISTATVQREWRMARAWLKRELES